MGHVAWGTLQEGPRPLMYFPGFLGNPGYLAVGEVNGVGSIHPVQLLEGKEPHGTGPS